MAIMSEMASLNKHHPTHADDENDLKATNRSVLLVELSLVTCTTSLLTDLAVCGEGMLLILVQSAG